MGAVAGSPLLTPAARAAIEAADEVDVSAVSIWEVAIKASLGRIDTDAGELASALEPSGFLALPVAPRHAAGVSKLPRHRGDPFDWLLVVQALADPLRLLTCDRALADDSDLVIVV